MSGAQHTPGPWAINVDGTGDTFISGADNSHVADLGADDDDDRLAADARLIAAAPDLLAVSRSLLAIVEHLRAHPDDTLDAHQCDEIDTARAAIAKAEGAA